MPGLFEWDTTALVVIDLQKWIKGPAYQPNSAGQVVANAAKLLEAFQRKGAFVVLVKVSSKDGKDLPRPVLDGEPPKLNLIEGWDEIVPELGATGAEHLVIKKQWGAFFGTDLELQLRRRGIKTIVLCGIATGIGVDTTAREAYQHGFDQIFILDAMTAFSLREHEYVRDIIFPRLGRLRTTQDILDYLNQ